MLALHELTLILGHIKDHRVVLSTPVSRSPIALYERVLCLHLQHRLFLLLEPLYNLSETHLDLSVKPLEYR